MSNDINLLKLRLKSALRRKHASDKIKSQLITEERNLTEEISIVTNEIGLLMEQLETLTSCISEVETQIARVEICKASEQCKTKEQIESLNRHAEGFKNLFAKEQTIQEEEYKMKEVEAEDIKKKAFKQQEEQKALANLIDKEAESIELECTTLRKRNNAIMLQLRRKLLETDKIRQAMIKNKNMDTS